MATTSIASTAIASIRSSTHIEYNRFLTNHAGHGIVALARLGADDDTVQLFADTYSKKLEPPVELDTLPPIDATSWRDLIGKRQRFPALLKYFQSQIDSEGVDAVVKDAVPTLLPYMAGAATHCIIHAGFGFEWAKEDGGAMLAEGLAYWTFAGLSFGDAPAAAAPGTGGETSPADAVSAVTAVLSELGNDDRITAALAHASDEEYKAQDWYTSPSGFQVMMTAMGGHGREWVNEVVTRVMPVAVSGDDDEAWARQLFDLTVTLFTTTAKRNDFFYLHLVTSSWSLWQFWPHLSTSQRRDGVAHFLQLLFGAWVAQGRQALSADRSVTDSTPSFDDLVAYSVKACAEGKEDEHLVKLAFVLKGRQAHPAGPHPLGHAALASGSPDVLPA